MSGFFNWLRRDGRKAKNQESYEDEPFDEETEELIQASLALLERMQSQSVNLAKPRLVTHLFLGSDRDLDRAAKLLSTKGFSIEERGDERLLLSENTATTEVWIRQIIPMMCQTAGEFELTYDGWDVDVAADHTGQNN